MRLLSKFLAAFALVALLAFSSGPASAHAVLVQSTPAANGSVAGPSVAFSLRFNSRIDAARSVLTLTHPDKSTSTLPVATGAEASDLEAKAELPPGAYSLRWQVLAVDGHITRGDVAFTVTGN
ncbi:MAG TPA: copper resistance CopC family protein [Aliidongia sp.]|nr:copper resistance CopC family protein [Aliidongia sp.]